jgi:hypothetical protein
MRKRYWICVALTAIGLFVSGECFGFEDEGFQFWSGAKFSFDINEDWKGTFYEEFRLGDDGGNLYYHHSELSFVYSGVADWLDLGLNFRMVFEKDNADEWRQENRPNLDVILKGKLFDLGLSNRSRFEYRDRENAEDVWRYRNKVTVKFPLEITALKLRPYVADEIFITLNDDNVDKNRVYSGVTFNLLENLEGNIFYVWQASRSNGNWKDIHALGTGLKYRF